MTSTQRHQQMEAARVHAQLTVHGLWLRYLALCGTSDAFELDGYLQGLMPLDTFQQDVLAQALNEALDDTYRSYRVPLSALHEAGDDQVHRVVQALLDAEPARQDRSQPPTACPPEAGAAQ